jgi:predicted RNA-binding Zn-ribbon protein involved in translation (DUF1610 family)
VTGLGESYTCERCGETFTKGWSDEEAAAEARDLFPAAHLAVSQATVCDGCYREIMAWAETSAPGLLREPPAVSEDPIGEAVHADAEAAREEIRASSYGQLACPSCGRPAADILGTGHCLVLIPSCEAGPGAIVEAECRDGQRAVCSTWDDMVATANISLADEVWRRETVAFDQIIGTGPANFTGLLSILEQP